MIVVAHAAHIAAQKADIYIHGLKLCCLLSMVSLNSNSVKRIVRGIYECKAGRLKCG